MQVRGTTVLRFAEVLSCAVLGIAAGETHAQQSAATPFKRLYSFCATQGCARGSHPQSPPVADSAGNLYGMTYNGGTSGYGVIYRLAPTASGKYRYSVLHAFCRSGQPVCSDGASPLGGLIIDTDGNLYGLTSRGGSASDGTMFELTANGQFKVLYTFCAEGACNDNGGMYDTLAYAGAPSGAPYDGVSPLYGVTPVYGETGGAAYRFNPPGGGRKTWTRDILYIFCSQTDCADGQAPQRGLVLAPSGRLYGTTLLGGTNNDNKGVIFELAPQQSQWQETLLHNICSVPVNNNGFDCGDGWSASSPITVDSAGNLYGTMEDGGPSYQQGVVFRLSHGSQGWRYSVRYCFGCAWPNWPAGAYPSGPLVVNHKGEIFGTSLDADWTAGGGGVVYELSKDTVRARHSFCSASGCNDGSNPTGVALAPDGKLYGTTDNGGNSNNAGVVFRLRP